MTDPSLGEQRSYVSAAPTWLRSTALALQDAKAQAKCCFGVLLKLLWNVLDTRRTRHTFEVPRLNSPLLLMISCTASDDILSRLFNVLISIQPRLPE